MKADDASKKKTTRQEAFLLLLSYLQKEALTWSADDSSPLRRRNSNYKLTIKRTIIYRQMGNRNFQLLKDSIQLRIYQEYIKDYKRKVL